MSKGEKLSATGLAPETRPEVLRAHAGPLPRMQAVLLDWLRKNTTRSAYRLLLEQLPDHTPLNSLRIDEVSAMGPDNLAELLYMSAYNNALAAERETRFALTWYQLDENTHEATVLAHMTFKLGTDTRANDHLDGTTQSIIMQLQREKADTLQALLQAVTSITGSQASLIADMKHMLGEMTGTNDGLTAENRKLRTEVAELEAQLAQGESGADATTAELMDFGMKALMSQIAGSNGGGPQTKQ